MHSSPSGDVVEDVDGVHREVFFFYKAIFQSCHSAAGDAAAPANSSVPCLSDESLFPIFLAGLPRLSTHQQTFLETPFTYEEGAAAKAANSRPPTWMGCLMNSRDQPSHCMVGPALLAALNGILAVWQLGYSFARGWSSCCPRCPGSQPLLSFVLLHSCEVATNYQNILVLLPSVLLVTIAGHR